jgi:hypothetical protein
MLGRRMVRTSGKKGLRSQEPRVERAQCSAIQARLKESKPMAISEDTAALVAAQLTTAWMHRNPSSLPKREEAIVNLYRRLQEAVTEPAENESGERPLRAV